MYFQVKVKQFKMASFIQNLQLSFRIKALNEFFQYYYWVLNFHLKVTYAQLINLI
jgi:hypothetical protein